METRQTVAQTPGPWSTAPVNAGHADPSVTALGIIGADHTIVARMPAEILPAHVAWHRVEANANLLRLAPYMLTALDEIVAEWDAIPRNDTGGIAMARHILEMVAREARS